MLDLSKFEKIKEDKHTATMRHKDGHEMTILIAKLPKIHREQLKRLKMADGGMAHYDKGASPVSEEDVPQPAPTVQDLQAAQNSAQKIAVPEQMFNGESSAPTYPQIDAQVPKYQGNPLQQQAQSVLGGQDKEMLGAQQTAQAASNLSQGTAKSNEELAQEDAQRKIAIAKNEAVVANATKNLNNYMAANPGKVDAQHFQRSMSDQRKVSTGLGLILGGIAGGINGTGVNRVLNYLQDQQNKDIEAQKASFQQGLEGQKTVFGGYMQQFHNVGAAIEASRIADNDRNIHEINQLAAQQGTLKAAGAANLATGEFVRKNAEATQKAAGYLTTNPPTSPNAQKPQGASAAWSGANKNQSVNTSDHILNDQAESKYKSLMFDPAIDQEQKHEIRDKYLKAVQTDKAIDEINKLFPEIASKTTLGGYLAKKVDPNAIGALAATGAEAAGALGAIPTAGASLVGAIPGAIAAGGAGHVIGSGLKQGLTAMGGQQQTQYETAKASLIGYIGSALEGVQITPTEIGELADKFTPIYSDSKATIADKLSKLKEKIRTLAKTGGLKSYGMTNED